MKKPSLRSDLARLRRLSWRGWVILLEATMLLGASRACVLAFPYRRIMTLPGQRRGERAIAAPPQLIVQHVAWAVRAASRRTPWNSNCLAQALAGQIMLGRRGAARRGEHDLFRGDSRGIGKAGGACVAERRRCFRHRKLRARAIRRSCAICARSGWVTEHPSSGANIFLTRSREEV